MEKEIGQINQTKETNELTTEKLKTYKGFEDLNEEKAKESIKAIRSLARILFSAYTNENKGNVP
ncbi:MAG TPA: hypothetical protein VN026_01280 [Bacteroidia bacterium]|jgi:hypothetical protein|nr:hypothetical protein [Bacteroidia bacterium]